MGHSQTDPSPKDLTQPQVRDENHEPELHGTNGHAAHNGYGPGNQNDQHHSQPPPNYVPENGSHPQPQQFFQPPEPPKTGHQQPQQHHHHQYPTYQNQSQPAPNPHAHFMYPNGLHQPAQYPTQSPPPPPYQPNQAYMTHPQTYPPPPPPPPFQYQYQPANNYNQQGQAAQPAVQFSPHNNVNVNGGQAAQGYPIPVKNQAPLQKWNSELFDCMDDPMNAVITACFPCITFGQIAEIVDNGNTSCGTSGLLYGLIAFLIGVPCIMSCTYRTKLRSKYGLLETPAPDWVTHCICEWCALCQEYRELKHRGLDPSIGWQANMALQQQQQQQQQVYTVPPMNQRMTG